MVWRYPYRLGCLMDLVQVHALEGFLLGRDIGVVHGFGAGVVRGGQELGRNVGRDLHVAHGFQKGIGPVRLAFRSEEHTSELQSLMRISYAVFCLKTKNQQPSSHYYLYYYTEQ